MRALPLLALLALPLGACASMREQSVEAKAPSPECRHVQSPDGKTLRFCELGNRLIVDDKPVGPDVGGDTKRLVDDPQFLADMIQQLPKQKPLAAPKGKTPKGAKTAEKVCTMEQPGYITIAVKDIERLMQLSAERALSARPESSTADVAALQP